MKIDRVTLRKVRGSFDWDGTFWESRLARPIDIYPEYRNAMPFWGGTQDSEGKFRLSNVFLEIGTDEGLKGVFGPTSDAVACLLYTSPSPRD